MKVKIIVETDGEKLEKKVNDFITKPDIKIIDLKFSGAGFALWPVFSVMITYDE